MRTGTAVACAMMSLATACAQAPSSPNPAPDSVQQDSRQLVTFPDDMRLHTIANMRDHLHSLEQIDSALSRGDYEEAAAVAEQRLGMSSLEAHGASHLAGFMPEGMRQIGSQMHRAASRFALEAQNASATNDARPPLAALATVIQQCVACHAAYRLQ